MVVCLPLPLSLSSHLCSQRPSRLLALLLAARDRLSTASARRFISDMKWLKDETVAKSLRPTRSPCFCVFSCLSPSLAVSLSRSLFLSLTQSTPPAHSHAVLVWVDRSLMTQRRPNRRRRILLLPISSPTAADRSTCAPPPSKRSPTQPNVLLLAAVLVPSSWYRTCSLLSVNHPPSYNYVYLRLAVRWLLVKGARYRGGFSSCRYF